MQPMPETFGTPRRPMDVEDYIDILRRHRSWIIGPTFAALVISVVVAFFWPDTYVSEATLRIVPPQVPERLVPTNINSQMSQRINGMFQTIVSRTSLQMLIEKNGLYPSQRSRMPMDDVIEDMSKDIKVVPFFGVRSGEPGATAGAFKITFAYQDRVLARKVVQAIVSGLTNESVRGREMQSVTTTSFLSDQVGLAKKSLDEIENRLTQYKLRYAGRLPDQLDSNLQQLRTLETRLGAVGSSISRVSQDKLALDSQLRILREQRQGIASSPATSMEAAAKNERLVQLERNILALENTLSSLREQYKDTHPDIRRAQAQLAAMKKSRDQLLEDEKTRLAEAPKKEAPPVNTPQMREIDATIQRAQAFIQAKDLEIEQYVKEQAQIDRLIKQYQQRIESSPLAEREYVDLTREYQLAKQRYDDMSVKLSHSEVASDLETRKIGELLDLVDQPSLPLNPAEPKRWLIISAGTALGLMLGLFVAGGREMKDTSLKNLKDVRAYTNLQVLGSVPLLENDLVVRRKRRVYWLAWSSATITGVLVMIGSVYYYYTKGS